MAPALGSGAVAVTTNGVVATNSTVLGRFFAGLTAVESLTLDGWAGIQIRVDARPREPLGDLPSPGERGVEPLVERGVEVAVSDRLVRRTGLIEESDDDEDARSQVTQEERKRLRYSFVAERKKKLKIRTHSRASKAN
jgi:hypothetical protein